MDTKALKVLVKLSVAVSRRNWEEVEKEIERLTEIILAEYIKPDVRPGSAPVFDGATRYAGNSGLSGGCTQAAA